MAKSCPSAIASNLTGEIDFLCSQYTFLSNGFQTDLRELQQILSSFPFVLLVAEKKLEENHVLQNCDGRLSDLLLKVNNLFQELKDKDLWMPVEKPEGYKSKVSKFCWSIKNYFKMKLIRKRLSELLAEISTPNHDIVVARRLSLEQMIKKIHSEYIFPVGRDQDVRNIIDILKQPSDVGKLSIIPIFGTAGVGKSTLARLVYNDTTISEHFQLKMWVNLSQDFDVIRLLKDVYNCATNRKCAYFFKNVDAFATDRRHIDLTVDELFDDLVPIIQDKKVLLILDNVKVENDDKWRKVKEFFTAFAAGGSKILVTTRSENVAAITGTVPPYFLGGLSHELCMSLFLRLAFGNGDERSDNTYCKEIVEKSSGIPLIIRSLGTLLYQTEDRSHGLLIMKSYLNQEVEVERINISTVLKLSYAFLPPQLQKCLAYCALFPKGYRFNSEYLIQCWMAARFLTPHNEIEELEDVGLLYCKVLFFRCFFQDVEDHGYYFTFKIHDVIHDFIVEEAQTECSIVDLRFYPPKVAEAVRHVSFINHSEIFSEVPGILKGVKQVETITFPILDVTPSDESLINTCLLNCQYLQFLCLNGLQFRKLPDSIGKLKCLTFLDLSWNLILEELSQDICKLSSLQALLLVGCSMLRLPCNMDRMISLRRLEVTVRDEEILKLSGIANLTSLQYLRLHDCYLQNGLHLTGLRTLILHHCNVRDWVNLCRLEKLVVNNCALSDICFGLAANLHYLRIESCDGLQGSPPCFSYHSSLKTLEIVNCPKLSSLPDRMQQLTNLTQLKIQNCPILSESCRQRNWLISHVPNIQLDPAVASSSRE